MVEYRDTLDQDGGEKAGPDPSLPASADEHCE